MKEKILIIKNITHENPGLLAFSLDRFKIPFLVIDLSQGEPLPAADSFQALFVLGGPQSANDENGHIPSLLAYIQNWLSSGKPFLGICLGMQLLAKASGGKVMHAPQKEIGFVDEEGKPFMIHLTSESTTDPVFSGLEPVLPVFQLHGETIEPGPKTALLATAQDCRQQGIRYGKSAYGFQGHLELTRQMLAEWHEKDAGLRKLPFEKLDEQFSLIERKYNENANLLFGNFLNLAGLCQPAAS